MGQSAWLKRLVCMVRSRGNLVKLSYSYYLVSLNQTDHGNHLNQLAATLRERGPGTLFFSILFFHRWQTLSGLKRADELLQQRILIGL